jgi:hypothetical protein
MKNGVICRVASADLDQEQFLRDTDIVQAQGSLCVMVAKAPMMNLVRPMWNVP